MKIYLVMPKAHFINLAENCLFSYWYLDGSIIPFRKTSWNASQTNEDKKEEAANESE